MGKLEVIVEPGRQDIVLKRTFDAPRDVVFKAITDPALIPQWWGPRRYETIVDEMDARPGGRWRYINRAPDGGEHAFHGVYHDLNAPESITQTWEYEGFPGHVSLETLTLEEIDGKTVMTALATYQSIEDRDGMAQSGMEEGAVEMYERLDEVLEGLLSRV